MAGRSRSVRHCRGYAAAGWSEPGGNRSARGRSPRRRSIARTRARSSGVSTPGAGVPCVTSTTIAVAVPQRAQLLQRLEALDRRRRKRRIRAQEARRGRRRARSGGRAAARRAASRASRGERVARPGNRRAAEVQRVAARVEHDLDDVGIEGFRRHRRSDGRRSRSPHRDAPSSRSAIARISAGGEQRLVALHVDDDRVVGEARVCAAASARRSVPVGVIGAGHAGA